MSEQIREITAEHREAIANLAKRSFPANQARFVVPGEAGGYAIMVDDQVVAAVLLRIIHLPRGHKIGFIAWLMTHPDHRGRGWAGQLVDAGTQRLREAGCSDVVTDVEGYNTGSANVFYRAGYRRMSVRQQIRRWHLVDTIWLWIKTGLAVDPGHFLWVMDAPVEEHSLWRGRSAAMVGNTALVLCAFSLGGGLFLSRPAAFPSPSAVLGFFVGVCLLLAAREAGLRWMGWRNQSALEYRPWIGGWGVSLLIAVGFGNTFALPGNMYPCGDGWSTRKYRRMLGRGAIISTLLVAGLILVGSLMRDAALHPVFNYTGTALLFVGKPLLIFDTLIAVPPFEGFNSRHLRDYHWFVWGAASALSLVIYFGL